MGRVTIIYYTERYSFHQSLMIYRENDRGTVKCISLIFFLPLSLPLSLSFPREIAGRVELETFPPLAETPRRRCRASRDCETRCWRINGRIEREMRQFSPFCWNHRPITAMFLFLSRMYLVRQLRKGEVEEKTLRFSRLGWWLATDRGINLENNGSRRTWLLVKH